MSKFSDWLVKTPVWVFCSWIPIVGGLGIVYAGDKTKNQSWSLLGLGYTISGLFFSALQWTPLVFFLWVVQIVTALGLKKVYLIKTNRRSLPLTDAKMALLIAANKGKIDINSCSKNDLVYSLGLPIVYANDIDRLRNEGYIFTHIEELGEVAGVPESYLPKIEPLVTFSYDINKETDVSWRRLNSLGLEELIACELEPELARQIIAEREASGSFESVIDVTKRTGIPLSAYRHLI